MQTTSDVVVCVPVLDRPQRVEPLLASLTASQGTLKLRAVFACTVGDDAEIAAVRAAGADLIFTRAPAGPGDFARKTNTVFRLTTESWFFAGADDLHFHAGWADEAVRLGEQLQVGMVGTNDLGNNMVMQGQHSTHSLFRRAYVDECGTVDRPGHVYSEAYDHQFVDTEAYETAVDRGCFAFAAGAVVEHLHPYWHKGQMDGTYAKGLAGAAEDRALFLRRRKLWT